jgi:hypothetical protein
MRLSNMTRMTASESHVLPGTAPVFPPGPIKRDDDLGFKLMQYALNRLSEIDRPLPHGLMDAISTVTHRALCHLNPGDELPNIEILSHVINFVREFVYAANLGTSPSIEVVALSDDEDPSWPFNRIVYGSNKILIANVSLGEFEFHTYDILSLGHENNRPRDSDDHCIVAQVSALYPKDRIAQN